MFCIKCGGEIPDSAAFCSHCGSKVETVASAQEPVQPEMTPVPQPAEPVISEQAAPESVIEPGEELIPEVPKKKPIDRKKLLIGLGAVAVIALIILYIFLAGDAKLYTLQEGIIADLTGKTFGCTTDKGTSAYCVRWLTFSEGQQCHVETYDKATDTYGSFDETYEVVVHDEDSATLYLGDIYIDVEIGSYNAVRSLVNKTENNWYWYEEIDRDEYPALSDMVAVREEEARLAAEEAKRKEEEAKLPYNQMVAAVNGFCKEYDVEHVSDLSVDPGAVEGTTVFKFGYINGGFNVLGVMSDNELESVVVATDLPEPIQKFDTDEAKSLAYILQIMWVPLQVCDSDAEWDTIMLGLLENAEQEGTNAFIAEYEENGWTYGMMAADTLFTLSAVRDTQETSPAASANSTLEQYLDFGKAWQIVDISANGSYITDYVFEPDGNCYCMIGYYGSEVIDSYYGTYEFSDNELAFHIWVDDYWADYTYAFDPNGLVLTQTSETGLFYFSAKGDIKTLQPDIYNTPDRIKEMVTSSAPAMP